MSAIPGTILLASGTKPAQASGTISLVAAMPTWMYRGVGLMVRLDAAVGAVTNFFPKMPRFDRRGNALGGAEFDGSNPSTMTAGCYGILEYFRDVPTYQLASGQQRFDGFAIPPTGKTSAQLGLTVATTADIYYEFYAYQIP